jgi:hypothetical protein
MDVHIEYPATVLSFAAAYLASAAVVSGTNIVIAGGIGN